MKNDCANDIKNLVAAGDPLSLGQLNKLLGSKWTQRELEGNLSLLEDRGEIVRSSRIDYVRGGRLRVVTYAACDYPE
jgi:hypothetical protein